MPEDEQQGQVQDNNESQGHPAWQEVLDVLNELPDELKELYIPQVTEKLKEFDQSVQNKFSVFNPYKPLVDNSVPMEYIEQAVYLAQQLEQNPEEVVARAIESFNLEKFKPQQVQQKPSEEDPDEELDLTDLQGLENHPAFKQLQEQAEELKRWKQEQETHYEEEDAAELLSQYLEGLHEEHGEFNDFFVTALMANGIDAEEAIETYQSTVKTEAEKFAESLNPGTQQSTPPVVLGNSGNTGSGVPNEPVSMGKMSAGEVSDLAAKFIEEANKQG